ncbi:MAG TPA: hypothetical protein VMP01_29265 [Pirellulaceae bacterium]|nr:hypothetical protein [Pirellulaceae bacterium]
MWQGPLGPAIEHNWDVPQGFWLKWELRAIPDFQDRLPPEEYLGLAVRLSPWPKSAIKP